MQAPDMPAKQYDVITADPPWPNLTCYFANPRSGLQTQSNAYPRMTVAELSALPIARLGKDNSYLCMWVLSYMLEEGIEVMRAWGYTFKTVLFCWVKRKNGRLYHTKPNGYYPAKCTELVLVGTRGTIPRTWNFCVDVIEGEVRENSRKPDEYFQAVDTWLGDTCPDRIELFAREPRPGWDCWGNQVDHFAKSMADEEYADD